MGSAVIQWGLLLAAAAACLPEDGRLSEAPLKLGEEKHKPVTGRVGRETGGPGAETEEQREREGRRRRVRLEASGERDRATENNRDRRGKI